MGMDSYLNRFVVLLRQVGIQVFVIFVRIFWNQDVYIWFSFFLRIPSAIDGQSHSSGCRFDTCSCWWLHAGETAVEAGTVSFSTAGGVHRLSGDN